VQKLRNVLAGWEARAVQKNVRLLSVRELTKFNKKQLTKGSKVLN